MKESLLGIVNFISTPCFWMSGYFGIYYGKHIAAFGPFLTGQHLLDGEK